MACGSIEIISNAFKEPNCIYIYTYFVNNLTLSYGKKKVKKTLSIVLTVLRSNPALLFRFGLKRLKAFWYQHTGFWGRLQLNQNHLWNPERISNWLKLFNQNAFLLSTSDCTTFKLWTEQNPIWVSDIKSTSENMLDGKFRVFDQDYQFDLNDLPWSQDWRYGYTWQKKYFTKYNFYEEDKKIPYDVKFPWELSRMGFLLVLAQMAVIEENGPWSDYLHTLVDDWNEKNPVASTINWEPMICAIHGISLSLVLQMLASVPNIKESVFKSLLTQISLQGEFLYRNIEDSVLHHNHYTSILIGLLLMGFLLRDVYPPAKKWFDYALPKLDKEILSQYYEDGVNFEKSISYHRLVTELFLLGLIVAKKAGKRVEKDAEARIYNACQYTCAYTRADGLAPNLGDNDGAWLLAFDPFQLRDHYSLLALAGRYFGESKFIRSNHMPSSLPIWLIGNKIEPISPQTDDKIYTKHFEKGGMFITRYETSSLIADYGEVGMRGKGGHGHNDTFSFEYCFERYPIIIDAGSPIYTGDIRTLALYASSAYHNTLVVDGLEIATMNGVWRISNEANPYDVIASFSDTGAEISGKHAGYFRLPDPVLHQRTLSYQKNKDHLLCIDKLSCKGRHRIDRFIWLSPMTIPTIKGSTLHLNLPDGQVVIIQWQSGIEAFLEPVSVSDVFGSLKATKRLSLTNVINGDRELSFEIFKEL